MGYDIALDSRDWNSNLFTLPSSDIFNTIPTITFLNSHIQANCSAEIHELQFSYVIRKNIFRGFVRINHDDMCKEPNTVSHWQLTLYHKYAICCLNPLLTWSFYTECLPSRECFICPSLTVIIMCSVCL